VSATYPVLLEDLRAAKMVEAVLTDRIDPLYAKRAEDAWATFLAAAKANALAAGIPFRNLDHEHWTWEENVVATARLLPFPTMGIECEEHVQGLMMLSTDRAFGQLQEHVGQPVVYVILLATAPWNLRNEFLTNPRFRGVGTVLLRAAVETSIDLGFKGRIGLHSLPGSETWYEKFRMQCLGEDPAKKLKYYEMTAAQAAEFIS
jgi:hypothetical protein